eukprot:94581_1
MTTLQLFMNKDLPQYGPDDDSNDIADIIYTSFEQTFAIPMTVIVAKAGYSNGIGFSIPSRPNWFRREYNRSGKDIIIAAHDPVKVNPPFDVEIYQSLFHGLILNESNLAVINNKLSTVFKHTFTVVKCPTMSDDIAVVCNPQNGYYHEIESTNGCTYIACQQAESIDAYKSPWLLLAGTTESPDDIKAVAKKGNGDYLTGVKEDLRNMEDRITADNKYEMHNIYRDMRYGTKGEALKQIGKIIEYSLEPSNAIREYTNKNSNTSADIRQTRLCHIYYTGHGASGTGNWCFTDGDISLFDIVNLACQTIRSRLDKLDVYLISDCCFSGKWNEQLILRNTNVNCFSDQIRFFISAGCSGEQYAKDTANGGKFTNLLLDKIGLHAFDGNSQMPQPLYWSGRDQNNKHTVWNWAQFDSKQLFV